MSCYAGWDVSTSIVGFSFINESNVVSIKFLDLRKIDDFWEKIDKIESFIEGIDVPENTYNFIEDRLANFSSGLTKMQTLMKLSMVNAVVTYVLRKKFGIDHVKHVHPLTVKAFMKKNGTGFPKGSDKKEITLDFVNKSYPYLNIVKKNRNDKIQPYCYDMADSVMIAFTGKNKLEQGK